MQQNILIHSSPRNMELLLEAFFKVQVHAHVEAWRYYQHKQTKEARLAAIDLHMAGVVREMVG